jgi:hypothetical protein
MRHYQRKFLPDGSPNPRFKPDIRRRAGDRHKPRRGDRHRLNAMREDFLCIDGESIGERYVLLASDPGGTLIDENGLDGFQIFDFLLDQNSVEGWIFGGSFDINHWLKACHLPEAKLNELRRSLGNHTTHWHNGYCYSITHYSGNRYFRVCRYRLERGEDGRWLRDSSGKPKRFDQRTLHIYDLWRFVGGSFASLINDWQLGTEEERREIAAMKARRAGFEFSEMPAIEHYNQLELRLLRQAVLRLKQMAKAQHIHPKRWHSPASLSHYLMKKNNVPPHSLPADLKAKWNAEFVRGYYGGRFEISALGFFDAVHGYDIRSAYPAAMLELPSLADARIVPHSDQAPVCLQRVRWRCTEELNFGPFPIRLTNGTLIYPLCGEGYYWKIEIEAARCWGDKIKIEMLDSLAIETDTELRPFSYLKDIYDERSRLKTSGDLSQYILKLALNASYGRLAYRNKRDSSDMRDLIWAGFITATVRARMLRAMAGHWNDILSIATDGLLSRAPLPELAISKNLGDWEHELYDKIFLIQPGFYYKLKDGKWLITSRGIEKSSINAENFMEAWRRGETSITSRSRRFQGYRTCLSRGHLDEWCKFSEIEIEKKFSAEPKRLPLRREGNVLWTRPPLEVPKNRIIDRVFERLLEELDIDPFFEIHEIDAENADL